MALGCVFVLLAAKHRGEIVRSGSATAVIMLGFARGTHSAGRLKRRSAVRSVLESRWKKATSLLLKVGKKRAGI